MRLERIPEPPLDPPEPRVVCRCELCGDEIYEGDTIYRFRPYVICERCVEDRKDYAEVEHG